MSVNLTMRDDGDGEFTLVQPMLGTAPYVLITATPDESDEDGVRIEVESGGGVPQDPAVLGEWLQNMAEMVTNASNPEAAKS